VTEPARRDLKQRECARVRVFGVGGWRGGGGEGKEKIWNRLLNCLYMDYASTPGTMGR